VRLRGEQVTCPLFAFRLPYSGKAVHRPVDRTNRCERARIGGRVLAPFGAFWSTGAQTVVCSVAVAGLAGGAGNTGTCPDHQGDAGEFAGTQGLSQDDQAGDGTDGRLQAHEDAERAG
jgi:hypothetical protein